MPVVLLIPNSELWRPDSRAERYLDGITSYIKGRYSNRKHLLLDEREFILSDDLDSFAPTGPHLSIEGYQRLTDDLLRILSVRENRR